VNNKKQEKTGFFTLFHIFEIVLKWVYGCVQAFVNSKTAENQTLLGHVFA